LIGRAEIVEDGVAVGIGGLRDRARLETEVHHARARDRHLRRDPGVGLEKPEMLQHGVIGEADLAGDANALGLGLHPLELDAVAELVDLDAVEHAEEIEMPPGAAKLAVGREVKPDFLLLPDDLLDLPVLDLLERGVTDRALLVLFARFLERRRAQEAADMIGAERRLGSFHPWDSSQQSTASKAMAAKAPSTTKGRRIVAADRSGIGPIPVRALIRSFPRKRESSLGPRNGAPHRARAMGTPRGDERSVVHSTETELIPHPPPAPRAGGGDAEMAFQE